jgi:hypothetical protein
MKRFFIALTALTALFISTPFCIPIATAAAHASPETISLTAPTHQQVDGKFIDDSLAADLLPTGSLGAPIYNVSPGSHIWVIDPALVEEVTVMSNGYSLLNSAKPAGQDAAKSWLSKLKAVTVNDPVYAMAYANPSEYWVNRLSPHDKSYVLAVAQSRLAALLGRPILEANEYTSNNNFFVKQADVDSLLYDSKIFELTAAYIDPKSIDTYRLDLIKVLNPGLTSTVREYLINDLTNAAASQNQLIHLSPGKFTVTSTRQKLPITLSNGFPTAVNVELLIDASNARVSVPVSVREELPAKSKIQILLPIHVYSSGSSTLNVQITTLSGHRFGDLVVYPLTLSIISPVATWITTGAAILLFFAATIQSIRRMRRRVK